MIKFFKKYGIFILILLVTIPSIRHLLLPGYFPMHDDIQAFRLLELDKCVKDGQIPCRWIPDMGYGYGYPQFNYYGPLPYYVMEVFHLLGVGILDSTKIGFALSVFLSAFGMYLLGKSVWKSKLAGLISTAFYIYAPYRAVNIFVRGAMGEAWGMAILPFIFWATKEVVERKKNSGLWLAISIAALFTSHNITALIFIPFYAVWVVYLILKSGKGLPHFVEKAKRIFIFNIWGFAMSAFFVLPAFFEREYVHVETILMGYFNYLAHYVGLSQLLFSYKFDYGVSELGPSDSMFLSPGIFHWLIPVSIVIFLYIKKSKYFKFAGFTLFLAWVSMFMIHPRSVFIWDSFKILSYVQFPWRFLIIASLFFSLTAGSIIFLLKDKSKAKTVSLLIIVLIFVLNIGYFKPREIYKITDAEKFSGESWEKQLTISIFDYLPIYAKHPPTEKAPEEPIVLEGEVKLLAKEIGSNWQDWEIDVLSDSAKVRFPIYYFPDMKALVNKIEGEIDYDNELGLVTLDLNKGISEVNIRLTDTPVRIISNLISAASLLLIPVYLLMRRKHANNIK